MFRYAALALFALAVLTTPAIAAEKVSGSVLKLAEQTPDNPTVNLDGLVVVYIPDSGSRPPQNIGVDPSRAFVEIGVVQGSQNADGIPVTGGGYTLYLFRAGTAGKAPITVTYTLNDEDETKFKKTYDVKIEKETSDED